MDYLFDSEALITLTTNNYSDSFVNKTKLSNYTSFLNSSTNFIKPKQVEKMSKINKFLLNLNSNTNKYLINSLIIPACVFFLLVLFVLLTILFVKKFKRKESEMESGQTGSTSFIACYGTETSESNGNSTILTAFGSACPSTGELDFETRKDSLMPYYDINSSYQDIYAVTSLSTFGRGLKESKNLILNTNNLEESLLDQKGKIFPRTNPNFRNHNSKSIISCCEFNFENANTKCEDYLRKQCF